MALTSSEDAKRQELPRDTSAITEDFDALDRQLRSQLLRVAWVIVKDWSLAADAVQAAFLTLHQKWGEVPPENRPGWLVRAVQFSALQLRRSQHAFEQVPRMLFNNSISAKSGFDDQAEKLQQVRKLLDELPLDQRQIVQLRLVDGLTFREIADRIGIPLGTALSRMRLALEKLKSMVGDGTNE